ncbi:hypothetical protein [Oceanirhabdus sp. W0125-5]|uniref:hypothetical protein n=1 Tax=Oceanirhabdus sp. W0125-5 TaxID=2999116 RepID=UPI0022F31E8C|nr:hypothetical protein [Oceanirhabdus sp. W0125-5]WBW95016.1 hypothetical protein OW730_15105 [Oceanirhabdus sp. W0125-5]
MGISQILYILLIGFVMYNMIKRGGCCGSHSHRHRSSRGGCCGEHSHHGERHNEWNQENHNYSNDMEVENNNQEGQKRIGY